MEIYDINGQIIDPLAGKTLYVAGDSIAYGKGSAGGYGKCIADRYGMQLINEAVDGATLATLVPDNVNGGYRTSIGMTVKSSTELEKADYILLEGGVNDAWNNAKLGTLNGSFAPAFYSGDTIGTLEAMLDYLAKKRSDKRVAYVFPHGGLFASSENWYKTYKPAILAALKKWGVFHDFSASTICTNRHTCTDDLTIGNQIRGHAKIFCSTAKSQTEKGKRLYGGMEKILAEKNLPYHINHVSSLGSLFFTEQEVVDYTSAKSSDTKAFSEYFKGMLAQGIHMAPSQFEAMFLSVAHTDEIIDQTLEAVRNYFTK